MRNISEKHINEREREIERVLCVNEKLNCWKDQNQVKQKKNKIKNKNLVKVEDKAHNTILKVAFVTRINYEIYRIKRSYCYK